MKKQLIIGCGEVGLGLKKVLTCDCLDIGNPPKKDGYDVIHIALPYSKKFIKTVRDCAKQFNPKLIIIHSSVPVGTTKLCGEYAVHSPIRGIHPHLDKGIKTFVKYFGGSKARYAAQIFKKHGIKTKTTDKAENTEALKLWDTEQYREFILLNKKIWKYCERHNLDFNLVYKDANDSYNKGYNKLGRLDVTRPNLKYVPGKIGGHCIEPNHRLLNNKP